jgi:hypothetical protein
MERTEIIETTLGDLVVALTEETAPFIDDKEELYKLVGFMLSNLLNSETARTSRYWQ